MFERFTDRARKAMAIANQEAQRFNHEYVGTEHILLGLVKEGKGVGSTVLTNMNIDLRKVRLDVEKLIVSGPEIIVTSRPPHTPRAKLVLTYAIEEAKELGHNYVGTEHLLLGLIKATDGISSQVLINLGATLDKTRQAVLDCLGDPKKPVKIDAADATSGSQKNDQYQAILHALLDKGIALAAAKKLSIVAAFAEVYENNRDNL